MRLRFAFGFTAFCLCSVAAAAPSLEDITSSSSKEAIEYVVEHGWMNGYGDGSFRPDRTLRKAEFAKVLVLASGNADEAKACKLRPSEAFSDVPADSWFAPFVCAAVRLDLFKRPESGLFEPGRRITFAEAAKTLAMGIDDMPLTNDEIWYKPYVSHLVAQGAVPTSIAATKSYVTRAELAEIIWRLKEDKTDLPCTSEEQLLGNRCTWFEEQYVPGVDMEEVKRTWLGWTNGVRTQLGAQPLRYDKQLTRTAFTWSKQAATANAITHKRKGQTAYYDYNRMVDWFEDYNVTFANIDRVTFTESIGYGYFKCPKDADCTKAFTDAVRSTFDFYMSEKGKQYAPHYNSIVNPEFRELGLGIAVTGNKYFLTAHYGTSITSEPEPLCP